jgi:hypothetical protein
VLKSKSEAFILTNEAVRGSESAFRRYEIAFNGRAVSVFAGAFRLVVKARKSLQRPLEGCRGRDCLFKAVSPQECS